MSLRPVTDRVSRISLGFVNVFLISGPESLTLVDAGVRGSWRRIVAAIRDAGRRPEEITDIVVTHLHADHTGGLAEAQIATGARVWMHRADAEMVRTGLASRPYQPTPGNPVGWLFKLVGGRGPSRIAPATVDAEIVDREEIPVAGGMIPVCTPGHTRGHVAYLWPGDGGVLFVGDAAARTVRLVRSPIHEDLDTGMESLRVLGGLDFAVACFAHGRAIRSGASAAFARKWPPR